MRPRIDFLVLRSPNSVERCVG